MMFRYASARTSIVFGLEESLWRNKMASKDSGSFFKTLDRERWQWLSYCEHSIMPKLSYSELSIMPKFRNFWLCVKWSLQINIKSVEGIQLLIKQEELATNILVAENRVYDEKKGMKCLIEKYVLFAMFWRFSSLCRNWQTLFNPISWFILQHFFLCGSLTYT